MSVLAAFLALVPFPVTVEPFPGLSEPEQVGCMVLRRGVTLSTDDPGFGGYSGLTLVDGELTLLSDAGHWLRGQAVVDEAGDLVGADGFDRGPILTKDGERLTKKTGDAEDLVWLGQSWAASFEAFARIGALGSDGRLSRVSRVPKSDRPVVRFNQGFEGLALLPDGRLMAISEGVDPEGYARVRTGRLGTELSEWPVTRYKPKAPFQVTAARADPETGDLYVLERAFSPWRGARMRLARVPADEVGGDVMEGDELTRMGFLQGIDNMEGLELGHAADGSLRFYIVSDDNFSRAQRTILLTLSVAEGCLDAR